jgi:methylmalonyl-CoA mutase cobalamin-binding subunit
MSDDRKIRVLVAKPGLDSPGSGSRALGTRRLGVSA